MGQFPSHGNKASDRDGFGTPGLVDLGCRNEAGRIDGQ
jgi:hypothetical protein